MSLAPSSRWLPQTSLANVAELGSGRLGNFCSQGWLQNSIHLPSSSFSISSFPSQLFPSVHQGEGLSIRDPSPGGERSSRTSSIFSGLLQQSFCSDESLRLVETYYRPLNPQSTGVFHQVSYGNTCISVKSNSSRGLDGIFGSQRRIPPDSCSPGVAEIPEVCVLQGNFSVPLFMLWPHNSSSGLHQGHGSSFSHYASPRFPYGEIPRRLVGYGFFSGRSDKGEGLPNQSLQAVGYKNKLQKESFKSFSEDRLSRHEDRHFHFEGFPYSGEDPDYSCATRRLSILRQSASSSLAQPSRPDVISVPLSSGISPPHAVLTTSTPQGMGLSERRGVHFLQSALPRGSSVVVRHVQSDPRGTAEGSSPRPSVVFGRLGPRLGSDLRGSKGIRNLGRPTQNSVYQLQGTEGYSTSPPCLQDTNSREFVGGILRQRDRSLLLEKGRGDEIRRSEQPVSTDSEVVRISPGNFDSPIRSGGFECRSRRPKPAESSVRGRVDPLSRSFYEHSPSVASISGLVCDTPQPSSSSIFFPNCGSSGNRHRLYDAQMGQPPGLCFSSLRDGTPSDKQTQIESKCGNDTHCSSLASESVVSGSSRSPDADSYSVTTSEKSAQTTALPSISPKPPRASVMCVEAIQQSARHVGLSKEVAKQIAFSRRKSTRVNYQAKWIVYRGWCRAKGHSVSNPSIPKVADFLLYLRRVKHLSYSAITGYRSMLSAVFRFTFPEISSSVILKDLLRSFSIERPMVPKRAPPWDLSAVLKYVSSPAFEPISSCSLRELTKRTLFLLSLATAKRVGELQAVSKVVSFAGEDIHLSFLPEFVAKTESERNPLPRSFVVKSLNSFVGNMPEELLLCPVRALKVYINKTKGLLPHPRTLFVSPRNPSRPLSKNAISYFLREVISQAPGSEASPGPSARPRAHSIRAMATSVAFLRNYSVSAILEAATWKSHSVFSSFYLRDVLLSSSEGFGLGPFVAANSVV